MSIQGCNVSIDRGTTAQLVAEKERVVVTLMGREESARRSVALFYSGLCGDLTAKARTSGETADVYFGLRGVVAWGKY